MLNIFKQRNVQIMLAVWFIAVILAYFLGREGLPFNRPLLVGVPVLIQTVVIPLLYISVYLSIFMVPTYLITRKRKLPDLAERAPEKDIAKKETFLLLSYGAFMLVLGQWVGQLIGNHGIGLHAHGSVMGPTSEVNSGELIGWALYNFFVYAAIPYFVFRRRGYDHEALSLKSSNLKNDTVLILVILAIGAVIDLSASSIFTLSPTQLLGGMSISTIIHFVGTSLPIMIFIFCILLPRYLKLTGSITTTVILGGLTYAGFHIFEYWTVYDSVSNSVLSLIFVFFQFTVPGIIKSFLTVRTGNAWVHLWAYHLISPHVTADTPNIVEVFKLK